LNVDVFHGKTDEIIVSLIAPDGTTAILHNKLNGKNIRTIYPTLRTPYQTLNAFLGKNMSGVWVLEIKDIKGGSHKTNGIQWSLNFIQFATPTTQVLISFTTISTSITPLTISPLNISYLPIEKVIEILKSDQDITPCLLNCSNHGQCVVIDEHYSCECDEHYSGSTCNIDKRQCSSNPCLNNSPCTDLINSEDIYSFNCSCADFFYGTYCENKVDICANVTCSDNGVCKSKNMIAVCECFQMYSGQKCEIESNKAKLVKTTIRFTSILAICILIGFYSMFILIDICSFYGNRRKALYENRSKPKKKEIYRYTYKN
jgi:hypothetical protein